jgi:hypothetical protein
MLDNIKARWWPVAFLFLSCFKTRRELQVAKLSCPDQTLTLHVCTSPYCRSPIFRVNYPPTLNCIAVVTSWYFSMPR